MLLSNLDLLATAPGGVARLRELILTLAVQGKLVPQDAGDEPASVLLEKIGAEKERLIAEGKIKRGKPLAEIGEEGKPFGLPQGWEWVRAVDICALITDGDHQPPPKADTGVPFLVIGDVRTGAVVLQGASRFVPESYFEELDWGKKPCLGDVLYTTVGSFGIPVPVIQQQRFCFQRHIALFRPAAVELQGFLALALRTKLVFQQAEKGATGIAQRTVPLSVLRDFMLSLPPLAEQSRIVTRIEELMQLCDALEAKGRLEGAQHARLVSTLLATLTDSSNPEALAENWQRVSTHFDLLLDRPEAMGALEQTVLQLAVRGLLVPQDPQDEPASALLARIRTEKDRLIAEGKIKRDKPVAAIAENEKPFELPVGWEWTRLAEVVLKITDGEHLSPPKAAEGMPLLTAKDVTNSGVNLEATQFVSYENGLKYRQRCDPNRGDVLICSRGTIGRCAAVETDEIFCLMGSVILLKSTQQLSYEYLLLHLRTELAQAWMRGVSSATAVSALYLKDVARCLIPVPPVGEQSRIVARAASLRRLCADLRQRLTERQSVQARLTEALVGAASHSSEPC